MAHALGITVLPRELLDLITDGLPVSSKRSLSGASHHLGRLPTEELVSGLSLDLPASDCCRHDAVQQRTSRTSQTLWVDGSEEHHEAALPELIARLAPFLPRLEDITLREMDLEEVVGPTFTTLHTGCPNLTRVCLHGLTTSSSERALTLSRLWPALAGLPALRRLKLSHMPFEEHSPAGPGGQQLANLAGVGDLTQLQSLSVGRPKPFEGLCEMPVADLRRLVNLTKLTLVRVMLAEDAASEGQASPGLAALTCLATLKLSVSFHNFDPVAHAEKGAALMSSLQPFGACPTLTSLHLEGCMDLRLEDVPGYRLHFFLGGGTVLRPCFRRLLRLKVDAELSWAHLRTLPDLQAASCSWLVLPPAGSAVSLPHLRVLDCCYFLRPEAEHGGGNGVVTWLAPQTLAQTFPHLTGLGWEGIAVADDLADGWGASLTDLLPASPAGRLQRLRQLTCASLCTPFPGACGGEVTALVVNRHIPEDTVEPVAGLPDSLLVRLLHSLAGLGPQLRLVELSHPQLDDVGIQALVDACPNITALLICCRLQAGVTDAGVGRVAAGLGGLLDVRLDSCAAVTPVGVQALVDHRGIESIAICDCDLVPERAVSLLQQPPNGSGGFGLRPSLDLHHSVFGWVAWKWWELHTATGEVEGGLE